MYAINKLRYSFQTQIAFKSKFLHVLTIFIKIEMVQHLKVNKFAKKGKFFSQIIAVNDMTSAVFIELFCLIVIYR